MPSSASARTAASASSSFSPATKRSTTARVAGVPTTRRRSAGRREAASSALCISTGLHLQDRRARSDALTLRTETSRDQRQTYDLTLARFIHLYRGGGP